jgi:hypothetical protein
MTQPRTRITRELDRRTGDGIEVRLLWCQNDGHVTVAVTDTKTGEAFELPYATASTRSTCSITPTHTRRGHGVGVSPSRPPIRRSDNPKRRQRCNTTPTPNRLSLSRPLEVR